MMESGEKSLAIYKEKKRRRRLEEELHEIFDGGVCDKCQGEGGSVPLKNNAGVFEYLNHLGQRKQFGSLCRHLNETRRTCLIN